MKFTVSVILLLLFVGCNHLSEPDRTPPAEPRGARTISLDNAVEIQWLANTEPDLDGYKVWVSDRYDGEYQLIGTTTNTKYTDNGAKNGITYYYALSAFDFDGNESDLTDDVIYDTPRPEGYGVSVFNFRTTPNLAGYDFSSNTIGPYDDEFTDVFFEHVNGISYLDVWDDTEVQDMGYSKNLDEISVAPAQGWAPSKSVEAIPGHTYVIYTWDFHYAKVRVIQVNPNQVVFDWAYQTDTANPELKQAVPAGGKRNMNKEHAVALSR